MSIQELFTIFQKNANIDLECYLLNLTQKDKKELERIILEEESEHLLRSTPPLASSTPSEKNHQKHTFNLAHTMISLVVFVVLFAISLNNVMTTSVKNKMSAILSLVDKDSEDC